MICSSTARYVAQSLCVPSKAHGLAINFGKGQCWQFISIDFLTDGTARNWHSFVSAKKRIGESGVVHAFIGSSSVAWAIISATTWGSASISLIVDPVLGGTEGRVRVPTAVHTQCHQTLAQSLAEG